MIYCHPQAIKRCPEALVLSGVISDLSSIMWGSQQKHILVEINDAIKCEWYHQHYDGDDKVAAHFLLVLLMLVLFCHYNNTRQLNLYLYSQTPIEVFLFCSTTVASIATNCKQKWLQDLSLSLRWLSFYKKMCLFQILYLIYCIWFWIFCGFFFFFCEDKQQYICQYIWEIVLFKHVLSHFHLLWNLHLLPSLAVRVILPTLLMR